jgi:hypothetical protein
MTMTRRQMLRGLVAAVLLTIGVVAGSSPAAALAGSGWELESHTFPTNLAPGGEGKLAVYAYAIGSSNNAAGAILTDTLPDGVRAVSSEGWSCTATEPVICSLELPEVATGTRAREELNIEVDAGTPEGGFVNRMEVSGGGAERTVSATGPLVISSAPARFGFASANAWFSNADGTIATQAGSHPYALTFNWELNAEANQFPAAGREIRNLVVNAPPGVIGDPNATPQCTRQQFDNEHCPASSQVGIDYVDLPELSGLRFFVYNLVPPAGVPAQFGLLLVGIHTFLDASVRSGGDYGISEQIDNIPQRGIEGNSLTLWGVPADPSHTPQRCGFDACGIPSTAEPKPLLTLPTACAGPQKYSMSADSWGTVPVEAAYEFAVHDEVDDPVGFGGCDRLQFAPSIAVAPDTAAADTPAGLTVEVKVPQETLAAPEGLSSTDIGDTTVTLPEGVVINPGQAAGLAACQPSESGLERLPDGAEDNGPPACPAASKVGTVQIETPLLRDKLEGDVYVLQSNPPHLQLLVAASGDGVNLKLVGEVSLNEATGQLVTTFKNTPELPFTDLKLSFSGGAQAALATPTGCGTYETTSDFTPWSSPFVQDAFPSSAFDIDSGTAGAACPASPLPFDPSLIAGSTTDQAGGFTSFSLLLQRADDQQRISSLQFKTPEGLLGMISKVALCGEPAASQGQCPEASQIGHTVVAAGPGPYPLVVPEPGQPPAPIYLTGAYKGAPYGLAIVVPVVAGPFDLGKVVVRAAIAVDPHTAQLTVTTDPLPAILDGIPTDLRTINAVIDRPGFMFNPTNCEAQSFAGTATSTQGTRAPISSHFQMGSCQALKFKPNFKVSTSGRTSRANGASLDAKIVYPTGPLGANQASSQSNIRSVKVELPKKLPSRLTTLQKACTAAVFEADPASCPAASVVGHATASTPVLPVQLSGPAYFVSHGGEAFPSLIVVLQGYGVTVDLVGSTFISKQGITSSTFKQVPDVPIGSFELTLPEGPYSALAANGDLCKASLKMPTEFVAQNGAVLSQSTKLAVTGCPKAGKSARRKAAKRTRRRDARR